MCHTSMADPSRLWSFGVPLFAAGGTWQAWGTEGRHVSLGLGSQVAQVGGREEECSAIVGSDGLSPFPFWH